MNPVVKSYHTDARGEAEGWFGAGIHPALLDSNGHAVMGTEWRVDAIKAPNLFGCSFLINQLVAVEVGRRTMSETEEICREIHSKTGEVCSVSIPIVLIDGQYPTVVHEPKSNYHRLVYGGK